MATPTAPDAARETLTVLLHSDDANTRQRVRLALGRRLAADLPGLEFVEVATEWAVLRQLRDADIDLVILDGEAARAGGLGICRTIKEEVYQSPPVLVVLGRPQDDWLAAWSRADGVAMHPIDPVAFSTAVEKLVREVVAPPRAAAAPGTDLAARS